MMFAVVRFVWGKKIERDLLQGKDVREFTAAGVQRQQERKMVREEAPFVCSA